MPSSTPATRILHTLLWTLCLLTGVTVAHAQDTAAWHFKYFAGDPPTWKDHPERFGIKAECEIARAEKTAAGYPVGECYALHDGSSSPDVTSSPGKVPAPPGASTPLAPSTPGDIEARRQRKLVEGCRVACDADLRTCTSGIPEQSLCVQTENTSCIERCTRVEQLPHHTCINEVCLPDEVNMAAWQGMCESRQETAQKSCDTTHTQCLDACGP